MSVLISPYKNLVQFTKIQLQPYQLNSDIESNMELVLQQKVEKKCNKYGFVDKIYRISEYDEGYIKKENLSGSVNYNISYQCRMCLPIENTVLIGKIAAINQELVMLTNGPIVIFVPKVNIDTNIWNISSVFTTKKDNKQLEKDNLIKVLILKVKINQNDTQIKCIGTLQEPANDKEVEQYYGIVIEKETDSIDGDNNDNEEQNNNFIL
jgi:DNA-directed RNA polymerase subunit E'/Rpb7